MQASVPPALLVRSTVTRPLRPLLTDTPGDTQALEILAFWEGVKC